MRIGPILLCVGGSAKYGINRMQHLIALKLPMNRLNWRLERLVWIGFHKHKNSKQSANANANGNDDDTDKSGHRFCIFGKMSKDLVQHVQSFFNQECWV